MLKFGLGLGINKGRFLFNPLNLNPFLYYDARSSMIASFEQPTLDLDPSNPSSLDIITATRAGVATYTDANGVVQSASPNTVRVDHVQGEELTPTKYQNIGYTDFSQGWSPSNVTISNTDPYDSSVAKRVSVTGIGLYFISTPVLNSTQYTATFYARLVSGSSDDLKFYTSSTDTTYTPLPLTSEWQRFEKVITTTGTSLNFGLRNANSSSEAVLEISQPQLEEGTTASDFVANTTGAPLFIANATYGPRVPMILVEPAATNLVDYSNLDISGLWNKTGFDLTQNATTAPDGSDKGTKMERTAQIRNFTGDFISSATDTVITYSFWTKRGSGDTHLNIFRIRVNGINQEGAIDLATGEVLLNEFGEGNMSVEAFADGWFRVTATRDTGINIGDEVLIYPPYKSTEGDAVGVYNYTFGHQLEYGSVATSYIPTNGSTVTRNADDLVIEGSDFTDLAFSSTGGTVYAEAIWRIIDSTQGAGIVYGSDSSQRFLYGSSGRLRSYDGTNLTQTLNSVNKNELFRVAITFDDTTTDLCLDGDAIASSAHSGNFFNATRLSVGGHGGGISATEALNGHIKRLIYWPYHSDDL